MIPVRDPNHVTEALGLLTSMFQNATNLRGLLSAITKPVQDLEDSNFVTIPGRILDNAVGDALDKVGALVGESRLGRDDAAYRVAILVRAIVNRSSGKPEDLLAIAEAIGADAQYSDGPVEGNFEFYLLNTSGFPDLGQILNQARAAGTRGVVIYSTWDPSLDFVYGSVYGTVSNAKGFTSVYGAPAVSGELVTCYELT